MASILFPGHSVGLIVLPLLQFHPPLNVSLVVGAFLCGFQCIPPTHTDFKPPTVLI